MNATRTESLRDRQARLTRELILRAVADALQTEPVAEVSIPAVAEAAGVSLRTVYRYFPTRDELLTAAADWINETFLDGDPYVDDLAELATGYRRGCERFAEHPGLVGAMAFTGAGRSVRSKRRAKRIANLRRAIDRAVPNLPAVERSRGLAALATLYSMESWLMMREDCGLSDAEATAAGAEGLESLIDDLRRRDRAAARAKEGR